MDLNRFNPRQRQAISHVGSPLLVLAGAGSVKLVLSHIRSRVIQEVGIPARHITAVTTNKASREMRERINHIGPRTKFAPHNLNLSPLVKLIKAESYEAGLNRLFNLDTEDSKTILPTC